MTLSLRACSDNDLEWIVELRAVVLRADLERVGRFDPIRVRQWMRNGFRAADTQVIVLDGADIGSIAVRRETDARWLEYFYIAPEFQGMGFGSQVLEQVLAAQESSPLRLNVLRGSRAQRLYERHHFTLDPEVDTDDVHLHMTYRPPGSPALTGGDARK
ncbi:GNAT family N-acetyltransferase [Demequina aurantiaca]|uniref:GNAT family N-acetyltransferase n=1 Tax=Demequina aurantiaca TaxID=676200 RepID=UPI003D32E1A0